jgi:hypothetical protein
VDEPRQTTLEHLVERAHEAAVGRWSALARLDAALLDAAASSADPYLMIDAMVQTIPRIIAARVPLHHQRHIADEVEVRLSEALSAWELK